MASRSDNRPERAGRPTRGRRVGKSSRRFELRMTDETRDQLDYLVAQTASSHTGKWSRADVVADLIERGFRRSKGLPSPEKEKYDQLATTPKKDVPARPQPPHAPGSAVSTGRSLRTSDAAKVLGVDYDAFLRLAKQAGVSGEHGKHRRRYWSPAEVEYLRAYQEKNPK
jgi:hypothetical protein